MTNENYDLSDYTPLVDATRLLIRAGVNIADHTMWHRLRRGDYQGKQVIGRWWLLTTEIDRILKEETTND